MKFRAYFAVLAALLCAAASPVTASITTTGAGKSAAAGGGGGGSITFVSDQASLIGTAPTGTAAFPAGASIGNTVLVRVTSLTTVPATVKFTSSGISLTSVVAPVAHAGFYDSLWVGTIASAGDVTTHTVDFTGFTSGANQYVEIAVVNASTCGTWASYSDWLIDDTNPSGSGASSVFPSHTLLTGSAGYYLMVLTYYPTAYLAGTLAISPGAIRNDVTGAVNDFGTTEGHQKWASYVSSGASVAHTISGYLTTTDWRAIMVECGT